MNTRRLKRTRLQLELAHWRLLSLREMDVSVNSHFYIVYTCF